MPIDIDMIKEFIRTNLKDVRGVEDMADKFSLSPETLRKEFLRKEKKSLRVFLEKARIDKMKKLLETSDIRCFEVCFEAGFRREDSGAKTFKRKVGMTMDAYRAMSRNGTMPERFRESPSSVIPEKSTRNGNR